MQTGRRFFSGLKLNCETCGYFAAKRKVWRLSEEQRSRSSVLVFIQFSLWNNPTES